MTHDFAKSPRTYRLDPGIQRQVAPAQLRFRLPRGRWLLLLAVLAFVFAWHSLGHRANVDSEFVPGVQESAEYQEAMAQQAQDEAEQEAKRQQQMQLVAEFKEKLKNAGNVEPEYGFYDSLAGSSWTVPVQKGVYVTEEDRKRANQRYMLQAASVQDAHQAQVIVQRLRKLGLQAFYANDEGGSWYRINVGPFDNISKMNKAEDVLVSLRMMPLKRKI